MAKLSKEMQSLKKFFFDKRNNLFENKIVDPDPILNPHEYSKLLAGDREIYVETFEELIKTPEGRKN